ncbi:molybdate ABC transporter permease subunit [candidate division KSB1 bacterium]|nr:molybdate ABC transporter permease subunit [candidate division KSB1 bacterium]NIR70625.1 molybdate ABC transporter permease subunit [candidate division KSB1 bacterium]NIS23430.1 molybdate ABC transporter permease subunit [candidate division KSB1 bacterium]NIT74565.1 molybdate ABC transporter permease subunit [candidate division KSB1 bacterium]NIU28392.1 molybdate ABC transporter permease subunit [candidate division KSB1 bacterium]
MNSQFDIILLSLKVACVATLFILPFGTYLGWLFSRKHFRGKSLLDGLVNIPLVLPPVVTGYFLLIFLGPAGYLGRFLKSWLGIEIAFTWKAAVAASAVVSLPLLVRAVRVAVDSVDYKLEDAARMLRASEWNVFFRITLPLSANGIIAGAVLAFARALGEFGATIIFASNIPGKTQTIPLAIFTYLNQPGGEAKARILVLISIVFSYLSVVANELMLRRFRRVEVSQ